ncbi:GH92 family glycosyl hydrolase [Akkermansia sp. N21116]|uniref:GH92 family glycosyl hydrolase n=1 Tax=Akkermansia sp. N21116 TaxID=3040764 RepID=UPI0031F3331C
MMGFTILPSPGRTEPIDYVRPQIDSHKSRWFYFASASRPFGMVSLSPDTQVRGSWNSGYLYGDKEIKCFSHVHCWQMAGVPVFPTTGEILGHKGMDAYKSPFSHEKETVIPGYHKVVLDKYGITAELTATSRIGMHRYSYPKGRTANVLIDAGAFLAHGPTTKAAFRKKSPTELTGYSILAPTMRRQKSVTVYYAISFDRPFQTCGGWEPVDKVKTLVSKKSLEGSDIGGYVSFGDLDGKPLLMKVAISYVSEEQAALNMKNELDHWDFDRVVSEARNEWNRELGKISVEGGTEQEKIKFYTDLWHSLLGRHTFSDVNGKYVDNTGNFPQIRQVPLEKGRSIRSTYNSDGFWGAEFNLNILWSIAYPKVLSDFVSTLVDYYHNGGLIARGPSGGNYTYVMVGDQAIPMIAAAYNKGIRDFDVQGAYEGCLKNSEPGGIRDHAGYELKTNCYMQNYVDKGFVPEGLPGKGSHREGCAMTLYFAYQDWCMAQFAKGMNKDEDYKKYLKRSFNYRNVFDTETGWMRPKNQDGSWIKNFAPVGKGFNMPGFVESNSAIFTYYVPHNLPDLISLLGGNKVFATKLNKQFEDAAPHQFITPHGAHAGNWVDYENQPSLHMAHLFSHAGAPWLTQYWVRRIKKEVFGNITPYGGYNGDEDQGQMGALGVLMAIGLFDVQGGASTQPYYEITSPIFDKIVISLDNRYYPGKKFVIETKNNSSENVYIQAATLNGKPWNSFRLPHSELVKGGHLILELGNTPNKKWGTASPCPCY